jgi:hypothetical protein
MYSSTILDLGTRGGEWSESRHGRFTPVETAPGAAISSSFLHNSIPVEFLLVFCHSGVVYSRTCIESFFNPSHRVWKVRNKKKNRKRKRNIILELSSSFVQ